MAPVAVPAGPPAVVAASAGPASFPPDVAAVGPSAADASSQPVAVAAAAAGVLFRPAVVAASADNVASPPAAVVVLLAIVAGCGPAVVRADDEPQPLAAAAPLSVAVADVFSVPAPPVVGPVKNGAPDTALTGFPGRLQIHHWATRGETGKAECGGATGGC